MEKILKISCDNCDTHYKIVYEIEEGEPNSCPFCGRDLSSSLKNDEEIEEIEEVEEWED